MQYQWNLVHGENNHEHPQDGGGATETPASPSAHAQYTTMAC